MIATLRRQRRKMDASLAHVDRYGLEAALRTRSGSLARAAVGFSHLGRGGVVWFGLAALIGRGRRPVGRLEGTAISSLAIGSAYGASTALARAVRRPRPCDRGVGSLVPCPEGGSFPSDQAAAASREQRFSPGCNRARESGFVGRRRSSRRPESQPASTTRPT